MPTSTVIVPGPEAAVEAGGAVVAVESELPVAVLCDVFELVVSGVLGTVVPDDGTVVDVELSVPPEPVPVVPFVSGVVTGGTWMFGSVGSSTIGAVFGADEVSVEPVGDVVVVPLSLPVVEDELEDVVVVGVDETPDDSGFETVEAPELDDDWVVSVFEGVVSVGIVSPCCNCARAAATWALRLSGGACGCVAVDGCCSEGFGSGIGRGRVSGTAIGVSIPIASS